MYKQILNARKFILFALIINICFSGILLFEDTDSRNMIAYEIGALRDIEDRIYDEELIEYKSNFSYFSLLVGINGKHEIKFKFSSLDNHVTGISPYVDGQMFNMGYSYYFVENNRMPIGFNLKLDMGVGLDVKSHEIMNKPSIEYLDVGFGIYKKLNLENYPIYPRIEFCNRSITYNSDYKITDQIIEIQIPVKIEVPAVDGIISNKGLWISPNLTINDKDMYSGILFGLYHKFK